MTEHEKRIREALANAGEFSDADLRALLADLDAVRGALKGMADLYDTDEGCKSLPQYIAARAALSAAKDGGWLPIETAPKDGRHILVSDGGRVSVGGWLTDIDHGAEWEGQIGMAGWWAVDLGPNSDKPTAWQPLPNPPKGEV